MKKGGRRRSSRVGFNVPPNTLGHIGDDFCGSDDPTNSDKALKDNSWSVYQVKGQSQQAKPSTRYSEVSKILTKKNTYIAPLSPKIGYRGA